MAGRSEADFEESQSNEGCSFEWDDKSQLYYHPSSGFYYDPTAGWYYSTKDGVYYKFEDGNYVLLGSEQGDPSEMLQCVESIQNSVKDDPSAFVPSPKDVDFPLFQEGEGKAYQGGTADVEPSTVDIECNSSPMLECPPPPSEWLEDTLIDLYLSGYSNQATDADYDVCAIKGAGNYDTQELKEGEWIPDEDPGVTASSGIISDEGTTWDEENWRAQYGQVIRSGEESVPDFQGIDLWDWAVITGTRKDGKHQVVKLVGRLVRQSARLHPSMPVGGGLHRTAPICEVHLDLCGGSTYRDRAAERRALHGGFGVGPGQKKSAVIDDSVPSSPESTEEVAGEVLNMSFGAGSYARRILESMGWKEGESLGCSSKGSLEPLKAAGNKGNAGLGWDHSRRRHPL